MHEALKRFTPDSNWISAGLLTLLVVSFGIFAERHAGPHTQQADVAASMCEADTAGRSHSLSFIRFH